MKKFLTNPFWIVSIPLLLLMSIAITHPPRLLHQDNMLVVNNAALSHLRFGLGHTKGQDFMGYNKPYAHHPPALGLTYALIAYLYKGKRIYPSQYGKYSLMLSPLLFQLVMVLFHLAGLYLLISILKTIGEDNLFIWIFGIFYSLTPMSNFFGKMVCHESPTLFFMLLTSYFYLKRISNNYISSIFNQAGIIISIFLGCFFGWPAFFLIPVILVNEFYFKGRGHIKVDKNKNDNFLRNMTISAFLITGLIFGQLIWAAGGISKLKEAFAYRVVAHPKRGYEYSLYTWIIRIIDWNKLMFTPTVYLTSACGLLVYLTENKNKNKKQNTQKLFFLCISAIVALLHIVVFPFGSFVHPYWQFYLLPIELYFASLLVTKVIRSIESKSGKSVYSLLILFAMLRDTFNTLGGIYKYGIYQPGEYSFVIANFFSDMQIDLSPIYFLVVFVSLFVVMKAKFVTVRSPR